MSAHAQLAAFGIQGTEAVDLLRGWVEWLTYSSVGTTVVSGAAYAWQASRKRGGVV